MADQAQQIFASIGAMQTLIENFPMSIFNYLKSKSKYTSVIEFVLDLLFYLGVDADYIIETICSKIFKNERDRDNLQKIINFINTAKYATSEDFIYDKLGELDDINSDVLNKIEDVIKVGLVEILTALLSCNCIPVIADNKMDYLKIEGGSSGNIDKTTNGYVSIPVNSFDLFGKLNIPPTSSTGCCYYRVDKMDVYKQIPEFLLTKDEKNGVRVTDDFIEATSDSPNVILVNNATYYKKGKTCSLGVNELYKTNDFDAFLWFVLNRGLVGSQNGTVSTGIQIEKNKMVWDSRLVIKNANGIKRSSDDEWRKWLTSKTKDGGVLSIGSNENSKNLYPIMQLEPDNNIVDTKRIRVAISSQTYYRARNRKTKAGNVVANTLMPNHTMYKFNYDYVKNIKILSGKELLAGMVKYMYGGLHAGINVTFNVTYLQEKIRSVITQMIQDDDLTVENCYFEFSNDEYNNLLNNFDLEKYNAMSVGFGEFTEKPYTDQEVINALMEVTENGTTAGNITTIKKNSR